MIQFPLDMHTTEIQTSVQETLATFTIASLPILDVLRAVFSFHKSKQRLFLHTKSERFFLMNTESNDEEPYSQSISLNNGCWIY